MRAVTIHHFEARCPKTSREHVNDIGDMFAVVPPIEFILATSFDRCSNRQEMIREQHRFLLRAVISFQVQLYHVVFSLRTRFPFFLWPLARIRCGEIAAQGSHPARAAVQRSAKLVPSARTYQLIISLEHAKETGIAAPPLLIVRSKGSSSDALAFAHIVADAQVRSWQCALTARIISGGGFHLDNCRLVQKLTSDSAG